MDGRIASLLVLAVSAAGCSGIVLPIEVRTSNEIRRAGPDEDCAAWATGEPVEGRLEFVLQGGRADTVVITDDGARLHIVWPTGFSGTTSDGGTIIDDLGAPVFKHGEDVRLGQVDQRLNDGSAADPFVAAGIVAGSCFVPPPAQFGDS